MKVAVLYNRDNKGIINIFGLQNKEWYPQETVNLVAQAIEKAGHTVKLFEVNRYFLSGLEEFLPKLSNDQMPGIVFNLALGSQGKCRYTHIPAILEMAGIPYTGSSPLGHALALDKVIAKQIFISSGLPTPDFIVFYDKNLSKQHLKFPLVVKPRSEAASLGLAVVTDEKSLKETVAYVLENFKQQALVEEFIEGREVNVSIYGNRIPQVLPILELQMEEIVPNVFTHDLKFSISGKKIKKICPPDLSPDLDAHIKKISLQAYRALNIYDHARVDIRLDKNNKPFLLELNSMVSINPSSSFVHAAKVAGLDYDQLINKILEAAVDRYALEEPEIFSNYKYKF